MPGPIEIASGMLAGCGIFTNSLSLSYFISQDKTAFVTKVIMLLNSLDLSVCVTATTAKLLYLYTGANVYYRSANVLYKFSLEGTAFATCLLSVTRAVVLRQPGYQVNKKAVVISTGAYLGYILTKNITILLMYYYTSYEDRDIANIAGYLQLATLCSILVVVGVSNGLTIMKLVKRNSARAKSAHRKLSVGSKLAGEREERASGTVMILSSIFCFFNLVYMMYYVLKCIRLHTDVKFPNFVLEIQKIAYFIAVPLNSAVNPAVYFIRKQSMRKYFAQVWVKLCPAWKRMPCYKESEVENSVGDQYSRVTNAEV